MRDINTIDAELRILRAVRWSIRAHGHEPSTNHVDGLLDERLLVRGTTDGVSEITNGFTAS